MTGGARPGPINLCPENEGQLYITKLGYGDGTRCSGWVSKIPELWADYHSNMICRLSVCALKQGAFRQLVSRSSDENVAEVYILAKSSSNYLSLKCPIIRIEHVGFLKTQRWDLASLRHRTQRLRRKYDATGLEMR